MKPASLLRCASVAAVVWTSFAGGGLRGWNSFDSYAGAANETALKASAQYMATYLAEYGYSHVVVDGGWYSETYDEYGRPYPRADLYPSAGSPGGAGFKPIADYVHSLGLKFGVWSVRGIPVVAVQGNWPIAGSNFTASQAARADQNCSWEHSAMGVLPNDAGRAYYSSVAASYAAQGIDFVKIDCMVQDVGGLYTDDFTMYAQEMAAVGLTVSVSPGAVPSLPVSNATYIAGLQLAEQYRVTQDFWDCWEEARINSFPSCLKSKFDVMPQYAPVIGLGGAYPDPDDLPLGWMYHASRNGPRGPPSWTHLTHDEQVTLMSLYTMTRSPLMFGGALPINTSDTEGVWTLSLITNPEVLAVQNGSVYNQGTNATLSTGAAGAYAWVAQPDPSSQPPASPALGGMYLAVFNTGDVQADVLVDLAGAGVPQPSQTRCARDLWARNVTNGWSLSGTVANFSSIPPHGTAMVWLAPAGAASSACNW